MSLRPTTAFRRLRSGLCLLHEPRRNFQRSRANPYRLKEEGQSDAKDSWLQRSFPDDPGLTARHSCISCAECVRPPVPRGRGVDYGYSECDTFRADKLQGTRLRNAPFLLLSICDGLCL